jgi:hypothetical protein
MNTTSLARTFVAVAWVALMLANTALDSSGDEKQSGKQAASSTHLHDVLLSTLDISLPSKDVVTSAKNLERTIRERLVGVPKQFAIRFDRRGMISAGITQSGRLVDFKHEGKTVSEILTAFVVDINYNRELGDPSSKWQRVVWTIAPYPKDPQGPQVILITSRSVASQAGYKLPPELLSEEMRGDALKISGTPLKRGKETD